MKLEIEDVSLSIEGNLILDNLSLNIDEHEIISLIGPSASGKSSLLRIIAGFENISSGKVKLNGLIVDDRSTIVQPQNRNVGIIFQDLALFPHLSCKDNILFGISNHSGAHKSQRLDRLCDLLDIVSIIDKYPHEISGGEQQRIALARSLAPSPALLLMDEPFNALDEKLKIEMYAEIKKIFKEKKLTVLIVSHDRDEAAFLSDKLITIEDGSIKEMLDTS